MQFHTNMDTNGDRVGSKKIKGGTKETKSAFSTKCRPFGLHDIILSLTPQQRQNVTNIGFGGLLELQIKRCANHTMLSWLIKNFNGSSRMFSIDSFRQFPITADDVYDVLMVPRNEGHPVPCYSRSEDATFLNTFCGKYSINSNTSIKTLSILIKGALSGGGDDFKRVFVLYSVLSFLCPRANRKLSLGYIKALEVVENISKFDWCTLVLEKLCDAISTYHNDCTKNISACLIFLQLVYFHRLKWRNVVEPMTLPLIMHWTDQKVKRRCDEEALAKNYGCGELIVDVFPLSENGVLKKVEGNKGSIDDRYKDIKDLLSSLQRDAINFSEKYLTKLMKICEESRSINDNQEADLTLEPVLSDTQKFFMNEKLHKYIDNLVKHVTLTRKLAAEIPSFDLLTPEPLIYETNLSEDDEVVDLRADDIVYSREVCEEEVVYAEELNDAMRSVGSKGKKFGKDDEDEFWSIKDDNGQVSKFVTDHKRIFRDMPLPHKEVLDFCFYDGEGVVDVANYYKNGDFLYLKKDDLLSMMPNQQIWDPIINAWCVEVNSDGYVRTELNHSRFIFSVSHSDVVAQLMDKKINEFEFMDLCFVAWEHWLSFSKLALSSVDIVFIPFCLKNHYAVVAINFVDSKLQYLDNRKYSDGERLFIDSAKILCKMMTKFLESKSHPHGKDIKNYEFENIKFKWQTHNVDNDCGVYMMVHMKHFNGKPFTSPNMTKPDIRLLLRAEICAILILSDSNEVRRKVIQKVFKFHQEKPALLKIFMEKKKQAALRVAEEKRKIAAETLKKINENDLGRGKRKCHSLDKI